MNYTTPEQSELGKKAPYDSHYNPDKLFPIPRKAKRDAIGVSDLLPFFGFDLWNHYEVSWLNEKGKPIVALAEIRYGCDSQNIIESKSMKLYFNSLNNTPFKDIETVKTTIKQDIEARIKGSFVDVRVIPLPLFQEEPIRCRLKGTYLDELDIECSVYHAEPAYLSTENEMVEETLCSDLLKSNCLVTNQPDWCSIQIIYKGKKINHAGLLRYLISFRNDNEFHEQCIEKIFMQILTSCQPTELTVYGRSTRRGGLDINSYRSTQSIAPMAIPNTRLCRQ
ncbi:MAG: NADPH-dependent 7-cyano-7-deazaguanine reductase QueF [Gammaproteobacteria bacterium RIFCSPHIGHO2_12_FULL_45_9]|nr:MAG: NADPH-dependent 7-cyano-7-deazaguanine reductase QueF [Gammaproteobacteria bacterium RIFCSPHIGHO2_12_FULL_45_9]